MARPAGNPVLAPIRRWVLYSRTNLTISVAAVLGVLFVAGAVFGESPTTVHTPSTVAAAGAQTTAAAPAEEVTYDLIEVTESAIAGNSADAVGKSAPTTAMAYAHAYVDISQSNTEWRTKLGRYTTDTPGETIVAARPQVPIAITGSTTSEIVTGTGGERRAEVTIPTQAGELRVTVQVTESPNGAKWLVQNPFPTLDRDEVSKLGTAPSLASDAAAPSRQPKSSTSATAADTSATDTTATTTSATVPKPSSDPAPAPVPAPVPVPGPIPIPELDTPIPGAL
ncbi:hypothetical protein [Rhodococcus koreensis]